MRQLSEAGILALFDLGEEITSDGAEVVPARVLRSGYAAPFTPDAARSLCDYGVISVIDLRSPREKAKLSGIRLNATGIRYHDVAVGDDSSTPEPGTYGSLQELYIDLISRFGFQIVTAVKLVAESADGAVLIHCSTGRDRTGLVTALILRALAVPDDVIVSRHREVAESVADYVAFRRSRWLGKGRDPAHFDALHASADQALIAAFAWIDEKYHGTESYLQAHGSPPDLIARLRTALTRSEPAEVRHEAERLLGVTGPWRVASTTNSRVWRVPARAGIMSVKLLTDTSSDVEVERRVLAGLGPRLARQVLHVVELSTGGKLVIAPYLDGELVADRLSRAPVTADQGRAIADQYRHILGAVSGLPPRETGYGRIGSGYAAHHGRWSDALRGYLEEQRVKGPRTSALRYPLISSALDRVSGRLDSECGPPRLIPTDVNSRNYLITDEQRLVALNFPVIWQGDPAMPFGALQLHLDDTPIAAEFADSPWPRWRTHFYAAYHAFVICVYVERFAAVRLEQATPWGRTRPLIGLLDLHLERLEGEL